MTHASGEPDLGEVQLDSAGVRAHPVASTGRRKPGGEGEADARRRPGRSRGGLTAKVRAAVDRRGRLVRPPVTAGRCGGAPRAGALPTDLPDGRVGHIAADAASDGDAIRRRAGRMKAKACTRPDPTRTATKRYDRARYRNRNVIERFFGRIKRYRRVATRYEKKAVNFAGFVWLAALIGELK